MTVCIAAMCADRKALVMAADRMLTVGSVSMEFEHEKPKIEELLGDSVVLSAGDALLGSEILSATRTALRNQPSIDATACGDQLAIQHAVTRLRRVESLALTPLGYSLASFQQDGNKQLPSQVFIGLVQNLQTFNIGVEFLLAGFSGGKARIGHVTHPGIIHWFDRVGYHAIGSGGSHAFMTLIMKKHSVAMPVEDALFSVYTAKRNAEVAPGVGNETDLIVSSDAGTRRIEPEVLVELNRLYTAFSSTIKPDCKTVKEMLDAAAPAATT